jgi:hypothetical protein
MSFSRGSGFAYILNFKLLQETGWAASIRQARQGVL